MTAPTVEEALYKAASFLGVDPAVVELEVIGARRTGVLGLGKPQVEFEARIASQPSEGLSDDSASTGDVATDDVASPPPEQEPAQPPPAGKAPADGHAEASEPPAGGRAWEISCSDGSCFLTVHRPGVRLSDVEEHIISWPFSEYQRDAVRAAIATPEAGAIRIGSVAVPEGLPPGSKVFVKLTSDGMAAWAVPLAADDVSSEDVYRALADAGVEFGMDQVAIERMTGEPLVEPILAARGQEPGASRDSTVEYLFTEEDENAGLRPRVREDGSVDYRDLRPIYTVPAGTVVGRYIPAVVGEAGHDVCGRKLEAARPAHDTPVARFAGTDVVVAPNGTDLVTTKSGRPVRNGARIDIIEVYAIIGDVDFSTGNVDFNGDVYVSGDVQPGFTIRASGNVRVDGIVDAASIDAGHDVLIGGGVHGHGDSKVVCGGEMSARFLEAADVRSGSDVLIFSTIVRSNVCSNGQLTVLGRGSIVGGKAKAQNGIRCNSAGSSAGVATSLELDWLSAIKPGMDRERDIARYRAGRIVVHGDLFPGTTVTINGAKFPVRDRLQGVQFQATDRGIALTSL